jgi:hypothetical protein
MLDLMNRAAWWLSRHRIFLPSKWVFAASLVEHAITHKVLGAPLRHRNVSA